MSSSSKYYQFESMKESSKFFFKDFPVIQYDVLNNGQKVEVKNFLRRFDFIEKIKRNASIYIKWVVRDEDTPQVISHKLYNSTHYYWIVLMINNMLDPYFSFPLNDDELYKYTEVKYGIENVHVLHHYESVDTAEIQDLPKGIIVDEDYPHKVLISNLEYEVKNNDTKRKIMMLKPEYLEQVVSEMNNIFQTRNR